MHLSLVQCHDAQVWDAFVRQSSQGSVFCLSAFLDAYREPHIFLFVESNGVPLLGAVVSLHEGQPLPAPRPFTMYQGIMFAPSVERAPPHTRVNTQLKLTDFFLQQLEEKYGRIAFCLHHRFPDLRSFSWFHYHEKDHGVFQIEIRYTGLLNLSGFSTAGDYLETIRTTRRQEVRKAAARGWAVELSHDVELLDHLHSLTFERQGVERPPGFGALVQSIATGALQHDFGEILVCKNSAGAVASAILLLFDDTCAYYLIGANHPQYRADTCGSLLLAQGMGRCKERGLKLFDVVGINSPARGDYKTSFNAVPVPYYVAHWELP
jgi:hypothetical protein